MTSSSLSSEGTFVECLQFAECDTILFLSNSCLPLPLEPGLLWEQEDSLAALECQGPAGAGDGQSGCSLGSE